MFSRNFYSDSTIVPLPVGVASIDVNLLLSLVYIVVPRCFVPIFPMKLIVNILLQKYDTRTCVVTLYAVLLFCFFHVRLSVSSGAISWYELALLQGVSSID
jgi:ABC-type transport system involved in Fe-S cluster assembly fused permease/ATPase subunit